PRRRRRWTSSRTTRIAAGDSPRRCGGTWEGERMTTTRPPTRPDASGSERRGPIAVVAVRRIFAAETPEYFLLLGTTLFLVVFGLVMVLSSSSIESWVSDRDFFARTSRQAILAAIGVPLMLIAA